MVGRELNLYYDALALLPDVGLSSPPQFLFDVQCDIGAPTRRSFRVTPTAAQVGNHPLTVLVYDNEDNVVESASTTLSVVAAANPGSVKRILCIGDSTTDDTGVVTKTLQENLASIGGNVPLFIGTHGQAPYNMEARSGQTFGYFANGGGLRFKFTVSGFPANTPFWPFWFFRGLDDSGYILGYEEQTINGGTTGTVIAVVATSPNGQNIGAGWTGQLKLGNAVFNVTNTEALPAYSILKTNGTGPLSIANYISRFNFGGCDLLSADLGINDCRGPLQSEATHMAKIDAAKAIFTSYFAYNANGKVMICLTKSGASTRNIGDVGTQHDSYRMNIHRLRELIIQHFDNGAFDSRVVVCASGLTIDRYYGYPLLDAVPVAARYTETETIHGDLVHPRDNGYKQVADAMTGTALALLA
ncbi:hypothetical protein [Sphingomonas hankookensis]|uniref:hypothetical protein n=1 Tax=Sphingomonas hankookensis TaxID=563996 RepID=UPI003D30308C